MHKLQKNEKKSIFGFTNGHSVLKIWKIQSQEKEKQGLFRVICGVPFFFHLSLRYGNKACFHQTSFCFYLQIF
jgi:hypothetical protein